MKKFLFLAVFCLSNQILASGWQLSQYSTVNLGRAFAGVGVVGDDYSSIAFNPAGMVLRRTGIQVGLNSVLVDGRVCENLGLSGEGSDLCGNLFLPHFFAQKACGNWRWGIGIYSPFRVKLSYENLEWIKGKGPYYSKIETIDFAPTVAYQLNSHFSLGVGVYFEHTLLKVAYQEEVNSLEVTQTDINSRANGWQVGINLGLMFSPWEKTRLGLSYRSQNIVHTKGRICINSEQALPEEEIKESFPYPGHLIISLKQSLSPCLNLFFSAKWTKWNFIVDPESEKSRDNTWNFAVGMDYQFKQNWILRGGIGFDQTSLSDAGSRDLSFPDSSRLILSLGVGYRYQNWQWDLGYAHTFFRHGTGSNYGLSFESQAEADALACSVQYSF